jgi:hypothetical protein
VFPNSIVGWNTTSKPERIFISARKTDLRSVECILLFSQRRPCFHHFLVSAGVPDFTATKPVKFFDGSLVDGHLRPLFVNEPKRVARAPQYWTEDGCSSVAKSAFFVVNFISSYQDTLIFNLLRRRLFVSLGPVTLSQTYAGPD